MPKRALISVYDKGGIIEFASFLQQNFNYEILSTGGTEKVLREAGIKVTAVEHFTGFPEMLGGRVKTLHPFIHAGLLAKRKDEKHVKELKKKGIGLIDIVVVNLYPFEDTVRKGASFEDSIEQIDIGGPSMLRSAAKNFESVVALPDPSWYQKIMAEMKACSGEISEKTRKELAEEVFFRTASYDSAITAYLSSGRKKLFAAEEIEPLRYGENPHQKGIFYRDPSANSKGTIANAKKLQGKDMSFLNYYDADAALMMVQEFKKPTAVFVKHANPCGIASHENLKEAFLRAYEADKKSAFGVIVGLNRPCDESIAEILLSQEIFVEVLLAPSFTKESLELLKAKKNLRLLEIGDFRTFDENDYDLKKVSGGYLFQDLDIAKIEEKDLRFVTEPLVPSKEQLKDLLFASKIVKHVKSNAIVLAKDYVTVGIGAGQMSRVDASDMAVKKAGKKAKGAVMASDAFFPFEDALELAAKAGIKAVLQPGGSVNDEAVIKKAKDLKIPMVFTGKRAFKH